MLIRLRLSQFDELFQEEWILEDSLDWFDEERLNGGGMLLLWIACPQELLEDRIVLWKCHVSQISHFVKVRIKVIKKTEIH